MPIKGKGKTRGRKTIAAPPRPQLVVRKKPFWARRWVWGLAVGVALAGIALLVFMNLRASDRQELRDREVASVRAFAAAVQRELPPGSQPIPPVSVLIFPTVNQDLTSLAQGKLKLKPANQKATALQTQARTSAEAIEAINVGQIVPPEASITSVSTLRGPGGTRAELTQAQFMMSQGLRIYESVGGLMRRAASAEGPDRAALIAQAKNLATRAGELFDRGYRILGQVQNALGISTAAQPPPVPLG